MIVASATFIAHREGRRRKAQTPDVERDPA